jgi:2-dehydro-3-deoxyphosphogluconate aldolase/(4S)-4-hydroxy-2-oxoglutarate aldolase
MQALRAGYSVQKFFPAATNGGPAALKAIGGPLPQIRFCPTGGVTPANAGEYLALPNVVCVGGSWVAPQAAIKAQDWAEITRLARDAAALRAA